MFKKRFKSAVSMILASLLVLSALPFTVSAEDASDTYVPPKNEAIVNYTKIQENLDMTIDGYPDASYREINDSEDDYTYVLRTDTPIDDYTIDFRTTSDGEYLYLYLSYPENINYRCSFTDTNMSEDFSNIWEYTSLQVAIAPNDDGCSYFDDAWEFGVARDSATGEVKHYTWSNAGQLVEGGLDSLVDDGNFASAYNNGYLSYEVKIPLGPFRAINADSVRLCYLISRKNDDSVDYGYYHKQYSEGITGTDAYKTIGYMSRMYLIDSGAYDYYANLNRPEISVPYGSDLEEIQTAADDWSYAVEHDDGTAKYDSLVEMPVKFYSAADDEYLYLKVEQTVGGKYWCDLTSGLGVWQMTGLQVCLSDSSARDGDQFEFEIGRDSATGNCAYNIYSHSSCAADSGFELAQDENYTISLTGEGEELTLVYDMKIPWSAFTGEGIPSDGFGLCFVACRGSSEGGYEHKQYSAGCTGYNGKKAQLAARVKVSGITAYYDENDIGNIAVQIENTKDAGIQNLTQDIANWPALNIDSDMYSYYLSDNTQYAAMTDLAIDSRAAYDDTYVYVALSYQSEDAPNYDDQTDPDIDELWAYKAIQLSFASIKSTEPSDYLELSIYKANLYKVEHTSEANSEYTPVSGDISVTAVDNVITYMVRVPWSAFCPADESHTSRDAFRFAFVVSTGNGVEDIRHKAFASGCTGWGGKDHDRFATACLNGGYIEPSTQSQYVVSQTQNDPVIDGSCDPGTYVQPDVKSTDYSYALYNFSKYGEAKQLYSNLRWSYDNLNLLIYAEAEALPIEGGLNYGLSADTAGTMWRYNALQLGIATSDAEGQDFLEVGYSIDMEGNKLFHNWSAENEGGNQYSDPEYSVVYDSMTNHICYEIVIPWSTILGLENYDPNAEDSTLPDSFRFCAVFNYSEGNFENYDYRYIHKQIGEGVTGFKSAEAMSLVTINKEETAAREIFSVTTDAAGVSSDSETRRLTITSSEPLNLTSENTVGLDVSDRISVSNEANGGISYVTTYDMLPWELCNNQGFITQTFFCENAASITKIELENSSIITYSLNEAELTGLTELNLTGNPIYWLDESYNRENEPVKYALTGCDTDKTIVVSDDHSYKLDYTYDRVPDDDVDTKVITIDASGPLSFGLIIPSARTYFSIDWGGNEITYNIFRSTLKQTNGDWIAYFDSPEGFEGGEIGITIAPTKLHGIVGNGLPITGLSFNENNGFQVIELPNCSLTSFDASNIGGINRIDLSGNAISTIDLSANSNLESLYLARCGLVSITQPETLNPTKLVGSIAYNKLTGADDMFKYDGVDTDGFTRAPQSNSATSEAPAFAETSYSFTLTQNVAQTITVSAAYGENPITYEWYDGDSIVSRSAGFIPPTADLGEKTYTVRAYNADPNAGKWGYAGVNVTVTVNAASEIQAPKFAEFATSYTFKQNAAASPITVLATVTDGGSIEYYWYSDAGMTEQVAQGAAITPSTTKLGTRSYYVKAVSTVGESSKETVFGSPITVEIVAQPIVFTGKITDCNGNPVQDASVQLSCGKIGAFDSVGTVYTDINGRYEFVTDTSKVASYSISMSWKLLATYEYGDTDTGACSRVITGTDLRDCGYVCDRTLIMSKSGVLTTLETDILLYALNPSTNSETFISDVSGFSAQYLALSAVRKRQVNPSVQDELNKLLQKSITLKNEVTGASAELSSVSNELVSQSDITNGAEVTIKLTVDKTDGSYTASSVSLINEAAKDVTLLGDVYDISLTKTSGSTTQNVLETAQYIHISIPFEGTAGETYVVMYCHTDNSGNSVVETIDAVYNDVTKTLEFDANQFSVYTVGYMSSVESVIVGVKGDGDVNSDKEINVLDAIMLRRYLDKLTPIKDIDEINSDVNGDDEYTEDDLTALIGIIHKLNP